MAKGVGASEEADVGESKVGTVVAAMRRGEEGVGVNHSFAYRLGSDPFQMASIIVAGPTIGKRVTSTVSTGSKDFRTQYVSAV